MTTSRRAGRGISALLTVAGVIGAAALQSSGAAAGDTPDGAPPVTLAAMADTEYWTDSSGQVADASGLRPAVAETSAEAGSGVGASSADAAWSLLGPPGGDIFDLAVSPADPSIALAGMAPGGNFGGGLYRSSDGGTTWAKVPALNGRSVFDVDFAAGGAAYIGTQDSVWHSTDGGLTWTQRNLNIGLNDQVLDVEVNPANPAVLWAGVGNALGTQTRNLMRSTDAGLTWTNATPPLGGALTARAITLDPGDPNTLIVAFESQVWVTTDGGATWANRSAGLPTAPLFAVHYNGSRLLVGGGQLFGSNYFGLYQSTDLGVTWTRLHDNTWPTPVVQDIAVDPHDAATILVATAGRGVHRTTDGGATWELTIGGTTGINGRALSYAPGSSEQVFLTSDTQAILRSSNGGDAFVQSATGISEFNLFSVHANPLDPAEIAIAFQGTNGGGVFSSTDGGTTWRVEPVPPTRYSTVRFAPDGTLYALSTGPTTVAEEGLYRRGSDGSWTAMGPDQGPLFESELVALRFSANDPNLILLGGSDFGVAGTESAIWRSEDRGLTWTRALEGASGADVLDIEIVENGTDQEMVATFQILDTSGTGGIFRSENGGRSWSPSTIGLPGGTFRTPHVCASANDPHTFYLAAGLALSNVTLFRTADAGVTWQATGATVAANGGDLECDPLDGRVVYLALNGGSVVMRSEDGAATLSPFATGLVDVRTPRALALAGDGRLLMATGNGTFATALGRDVLTLGAQGRREHGSHVVDLTWQGATSAEIDVYRNGVLVATVPNNGSHTDASGGTGARTYTYTVCRVDSSVCSNPATVRFGGPPR